MTIDELVVDEEFKSLLPPLTSEQLQHLRMNIIRDGCFLKPFFAWEKVLVDGYHRREVWYTLPAGHDVEEPEIVELCFDNREDARNWIVAHAIGTRNMSAAKVKEMIGRLYNTSKKAVGRTKGGDRGDTAAEISKQVGKSTTTVRRNGRYETALHAIPAWLRQEINDGKITLSESQVIKLASLPDKQQVEAIADLKKGLAFTNGSRPKVYNPAKVEGLIGQLTRALDERDTFQGGGPFKRSDGHKACEKALLALAEAWNAWL